MTLLRSKWRDNMRERQIVEMKSLSFSRVRWKVTQDAVRIKVKTDRHGLPMWLLWTRRIITLKLYFFSHKHAFKGFSLFERDDRRFCCQEETGLNLAHLLLLLTFQWNIIVPCLVHTLSLAKRKYWLVVYRSSSRTSSMNISCSRSIPIKLD